VTPEAVVSLSAKEVLEFLESEARAIRPTLPAILSYNARFQADLAMDSLDLVELVARIEQRYCFHVPDEDLVRFTTFNTSVDYVLERLQA